MEKKYHSVGTIKKWRMFYGRHHVLVDRYGISVSRMTTDMFNMSETLRGL